MNFGFYFNGAAQGGMIDCYFFFFFFFKVKNKFLCVLFFSSVVVLQCEKQVVFVALVLIFFFFFFWMQQYTVIGPWHNSCPNVSMKEINEFLEGIITIQSDFLRPLNRQWKYEHGSASATFVGVFEDFFMFGTNQHVVSEYSKEHNGSHLISICLQCSGSKQSLAFACEPKQSILMYVGFVVVN